MSRLLLVVFAGFGLGAVVCGIQYFLIRAGRFRRNPFIGVALSVTKASDDVWARGHRAAAPWIARAGILAACASLIAGIGILVSTSPEAADAFAVTGNLVGMLGAAVFTLGADRAARDAVSDGGE